MLSVNGSTIVMIRGDTGTLNIALKLDGTQYFTVIDVQDSDVQKYTEIELTDEIQNKMEGQQ